MQKVLFPEAANQYIHAAANILKQNASCQPIVEACDMAQACRQLKAGATDAIVAGIDWSSRDVILACRDHLGMQEGFKTFSSLFVADLPDGQRYILSDGATCKNPTAEQLADIVILTHDAAAKILTMPPRVAILSFSTFGSGGKDPSIDKTAATLELLSVRRPDILVDGEMQLDAAVNERIGAKKAAAHGGSPVAGRANVLITPDINSGNILYKSLEQFAQAKIAGPILLGFNSPVSDLSRGSTVEDIVFTTECLLKLIP